MYVCSAIVRRIVVVKPINLLINLLINCIGELIKAARRLAEQREKMETDMFIRNKKKDDAKYVLYIYIYIV